MAAGKKKRKVRKAKPDKASKTIPKSKAKKKKASKEDPKNMMSLPDFAERIGVSPSAVYRMLKKYPKDFEIILNDKGKRRIDYNRYAGLYRKLSRVPKKSHIDPEDLTSGMEHEGGEAEIYGTARAQKEHYKSLTAKLEYREKIGTLVNANDVRKAWTHIAINVQKAVLAVPERVAPLVAGIKDHKKIRIKIRDELKYALKNLAYDLKAVETEDLGGSDE